MNFTSATPLTRPPKAIESWSEGSLSATVERTPSELIFEMRAVRPPEYGPTGATTWVHLPTDDVSPPVPPSATYRNPSGPKVSPRGLFRPVAKTRDWGRGWCEGRAATDAGSVSARSESTAAITILALFIISPFSGDGFIGWQREFNTTAIFGLKNLSGMVASAL